MSKSTRAATGADAKSRIHETGPIGPQLLDIEQVEALTRATRTTIDRWIQTRGFPAKRHIGRRVLWVAAAVHAWLAAQLEQGE